MNWEAIGAVGEIVGADAVVVTLIYLAGQVRHATKVAQAASFQTASALDHEFLLVLGQNPTTAHLWHTYVFGDLETLSEEQRRQGYFLFASLLRRMENIHQQHRLGTLSAEAWHARQGMFTAIARSAAYAADRQAPARGFMSGEFIEFMDQLAAAEDTRGFQVPEVQEREG